MEVRFAGREETTSVARKTLNPVWDQDFRFDVQDDALLQNEPLVLRVMDSDPYAAADLIGTVHVSLNPLLSRDVEASSSSTVLDGWFPIWDSFLGVRGELHVSVRVQFV